MNETRLPPSTLVEFWQQLLSEASHVQDDLVSPLFHRFVTSKHSFSESLARVLTEKLGSAEISGTQLSPVLSEIYKNNPKISIAAQNDIIATVRRDPAVHSHLSVLLYMKGFHALQTHRVAHALYLDGRVDAALYLQHRASIIFGVDCHPAATIGQGVMFDHATGIVIGETVIIEDNVSLLQGVTLGGTGKESGNRHPKIRSGVLIGVGSKILGNIEIGQCARIGAGSVVLKDVPAHATAVGIPATIINVASQTQPCEELNHNFLT